MCNCSEHRSEWRQREDARDISRAGHEATGAAVPANPHQRRREQRISHRHPGRKRPMPTFKPCRLDFREGCYQITFKPTAGFVTFEGTLRVDRSAPDGGADHLIVSGDLYSRRPVIGPITPVQPAAPADADEGGAPVASEPMSVAGALSAVDEPLVPHAILKPKIPIFAARPLSFVSQGNECLGAGPGRSSRAM